jgi:TolB-like protein
MLPIPIFLALLAQTPPSNPPPLPSVAVIKLQALGGISDSTAVLLTSSLVTELRETHTFSRVVSDTDLQGLLGLEMQKQLMDCSSSSCMAEAAGALGVDYVVTGNLGRLGDRWMLNVSKVNVKTAQAEATVTLPVDGANESALLPAVKEAARKLSGTAVATPASADEKPAGGMAGKAFKGVGASALAVGALGLVPALVGALVAGGVSLVFLVNPSITLTPGMGKAGSVVLGAGWAGIVVGALVLVVGVGAGAALLVAGMVMG